MSISSVKKTAIKTFSVYLVISLLLVLLTRVYELFSHDIHSTWMRTAYLYPLIGGFIRLLLNYYHVFIYKTALSLYHMGLTAFVLGHILYGIFEIYGSVKYHLLVYLVGGGLLIIAAIIVFIKYRDDRS